MSIRGLYCCFFIILQTAISHIWPLFQRWRFSTKFHAVTCFQEMIPGRPSWSLSFRILHRIRTQCVFVLRHSRGDLAWSRYLSSNSEMKKSTRREGLPQRSPQQWAQRGHSDLGVSPAGAETVSCFQTLFYLFLQIKKARDGIRTRDPRLGKAILHHWATRAYIFCLFQRQVLLYNKKLFLSTLFFKFFIQLIYFNFPAFEYLL